MRRVLPIPGLDRPRHARAVRLQVVGAVADYLLTRANVNEDFIRREAERERQSPEDYVVDRIVDMTERLAKRL
jgi:hypothetical protein